MCHARLVIASSVVVTAIAVPLAVRQQPQGDPFSTEIRAVKDGLYVIPGYDGAVTGGNVAVRVTNEGVIIVDDRLPPSSAQIAGKVRSVTAQPIRYMVSSHHHGDHTGGHPEFIKVAEIIAHRTTARTPRVAPSLRRHVWCSRTRRRCSWAASRCKPATLAAVTRTATRRRIFLISARCTPGIVVWGKRTDEANYAVRGPS